MTVRSQPTPEQIEQYRATFPKGSPRIEYRQVTVPPITKRDPDADAQADGARGADTSPIHLSMSSEVPVLRYDWYEGEYYYEVLDHSPSSIDMDYARDGMPFVASHRSYDADQMHGLVVNVAAVDRRLEGDIMPSRAPRSQEIAMDMRDGIRNKVSIGYIVGDEFTQTETKGDASTPTRRYTSWMPIELSTVPVPADYSVGVGRATSPDGRAALARFLSLHPAPARSAAAADPPRDAVATPTPRAAATAQERTMKDGENAAPAAAGENMNGTGGGTPTVSITDIREGETARIKNIRAMARDHACEDKLGEWISSGASVDDVTRQINGILSERIKHPAKMTTGPDVSDRDLKRFSFARALLLNTDAQKEFPGLDFGFEREVMQETERLAGSNRKGAGTMIPYTLLGKMQQQRAGLDSATATSGGAFKFNVPGPFIPVLRNKSSIMRAGATILSGLTGPLVMPRQTGAAGSVFSAENPGSDISVTNLTTDTVTLAFKSIAAGAAFSRQLVFSAASGNYDAEALVQADLIAVMALAIDTGALNGLGSSNQPRGLLKNTNIGSVTLGAQGGAVAWGTVVDLETKVGDANADAMRMAYITNTFVRGQLKKISPLGSTNSGIPIWTGPFPIVPNVDVAGQTDPSGVTVMDGAVNGYRAIASNQVSRTLVKGTTSTCSALVFGAFEHQLVGIFGPGFETIVDPYSKKYQGMIEIAAWVFMDANQRYDGAFAACQEITS